MAHETKAFNPMNFLGEDFMKTFNQVRNTARTMANELCYIFQGDEFIATSSCKGGRTQIGIYWADGPIESMVERITRKYQKDWNRLSPWEKSQDDAFLPTGKVKVMLIDKITVHRVRTPYPMPTDEREIEKEYPRYMTLKEKHDKAQKEARAKMAETVE